MATSPEDILIQKEEKAAPQTTTEILKKVQEKTKKFVEDKRFFEMQDELLNKAEKRSASPNKQKFSEQSPIVEAEVDDLHSQLIVSNQHQLRNRSVTKRDIKQEQKQNRLAKKQLRE